MSLILFLHPAKSKVLFLYFSFKIKFANPVLDCKLHGSREHVSFPAL